MANLLITAKISWPPAYFIRRSNRAKYISMRILPEEGLEIVLPKGRSERDAVKFLEQHRQWVCKHAELLTPENVLYGINHNTLPKKIHLRCLHKCFNVRYRKKPLKEVKLSHPTANTLLFEGNIKNFHSCDTVFRRWLKGLAEKTFLPMLKRLSKKTGLQYRHVYIRHQKDRWGSCSAKGDIYLNMDALFLPRDLVRYLLLHELCHLKYFNHSKQFWQLVASFDPYYERKQRRLRHIL